MSAARPVPKVYIFYGDDHARRGLYLARVRQRLAERSGAAWAELNYQRLSPDTHSLDDLRTAVLAAPLFVARRLVHAVEPLAWARDAAARARFLRILEEVPASTALVLDIGQRLEEGRRNRPAHWLLAWARKQGPERVYVKALPAPRDVHGMVQWLFQAARDEGARFTPQAAQALAAMVGTDTLRALQEVRKLALYAGERAITPEDVTALVQGDWAPNVFEWLDLVGAGQTQAAWRYLQRLLEHDDAARVWNLVLRHFRLLLAVRDAQARGADLATVLATWRVPPFAHGRYARQAARFSLDALRALYRQLYALEARFRRHEITLEEALEALLVYLTAPQTRPNPA